MADFYWSHHGPMRVDHALWGTPPGGVGAASPLRYGHVTGPPLNPALASATPWLCFESFKESARASPGVSREGPTPGLSFAHFPSPPDTGPEGGFLATFCLSCSEGTPTRASFSCKELRARALCCILVSQLSRPVEKVSAFSYSVP